MALTPEQKMRLLMGRRRLGKAARRRLRAITNKAKHRNNGRN